MHVSLRTALRVFRKFIPFILAAGFIGLCGGLFAPLFICAGVVAWDRGASGAVQATVSGHRWERTITVEELVLDEKEAWCNDVPEDAVILEEWRKKKLGSRRRQWRCRYETTTWRAVDTPSATGEDLAPRWPEVAVDGCELLGCQRLGRRSETLEVVLATPDDEEPLTCRRTEETWGTLTPGQAVTVSVGGLTGMPLCDTLTLAETTT